MVLFLRNPAAAGTDKLHGGKFIPTDVPRIYFRRSTETACRGFVARAA